MKQNPTRKKQDLNQELIAKWKWCQLKSKVVSETEQIKFSWKIMKKHLFLRMTCTIESLSMTRKVNGLWVQIKTNRVQLWVRRKYGGRCEAHMGKCSQKSTERLCFKVRDGRNLHQAEGVINVREVSIKSLIWSLKVNTAVLHNEPTLSSWDSPTLLQPNPFTRSLGFCTLYEGAFTTFC